eukprot:11974545-Heterocapsa_arctica.AAC.1
MEVCGELASPGARDGTAPVHSRDQVHAVCNGDESAEIAFYADALCMALHDDLDAHDAERTKMPALAARLAAWRKVPPSKGESVLLRLLPCDDAEYMVIEGLSSARICAAARGPPAGPAATPS